MTLSMTAYTPHDAVGHFDSAATIAGMARPPSTRVSFSPTFPATAAALAGGTAGRRWLHVAALVALLAVVGFGVRTGFGLDGERSESQATVSPSPLPATPAEVAPTPCHQPPPPSAGRCRDCLPGSHTHAPPQQLRSRYHVCGARTAWVATASHRRAATVVAFGGRGARSGDGRVSRCRDNGVWQREVKLRLLASAPEPPVGCVTQTLEAAEECARLFQSRACAHGAAHGRVAPPRPPRRRPPAPYRRFPPRSHDVARHCAGARATPGLPARRWCSTHGRAGARRNTGNRGSGGGGGARGRIGSGRDCFQRLRQPAARLLGGGERALPHPGGGVGAAWARPALATLTRACWSVGLSASLADGGQGGHDFRRRALVIGFWVLVSRL